jgi:hypothetical protein
MIYKEFDLGYLDDVATQRVYDALNRRTYMKFEVSHGCGPSGNRVYFGTQYDASRIEIMEFAMHCLASHK